MILKYNDFILEKLLLLESNVVYSDKFRTVLTRIKDDNISKQLIEIENKDLDVLSNFFDVKVDNENVVTFTPDSTAQQILNDKKDLVKYVGRRGGWLTNNIEANGNIFQVLGFTPTKTEVYHPANTDVGEIVSKFKSKKSGKTWCYVKFTNGEGVYDITRLADIPKPDLKKMVFTKNRQEIRTGRAIRALLNASKINVTDAEIENFVNAFRSILSVMNDVFSRFDIVEGDDLGFWYNRKNYMYPGRGSLATSCQAVGRLDWLEIYIKNPQTVKLLILRSEEDWDKIVGRSLLWTLEDGSTLMDVIYVSKQSDESVFKEYAKSKNWLSVYTGGTYVAYINPGEFNSYPSVDSMNKWDPKTGKISNRNFPGCKHITWTNDGDDDFDDFEEDYED